MRSGIVSIGLAALFLAAGCVSSGSGGHYDESLANAATAAHPPLGPGALVSQPPPAPLVEKKSPQPTPEHVWIDGWWGWSREDQYAWRPGHWEIPRSPQTRWVAPVWTKEDGGWRFTPGEWRWEK
jgi:hypothetical protein